MLKRRILEILLVLVAISVYAWMRQQSLPSDQTWLTLDSPRGEYIGQGRAWRFSSEGAEFKADYPYKKAELGVRVQVKGPGQDYFWLEFAAPHSQKLMPGTYSNAARFAFHDADQPGLDVSGCGRGNNRLQGTFKVLEIAYGESGPTRLAIDFLQDGEGNRTPPLKGSVRFHSSVK